MWFLFTVVILYIIFAKVLPMFGKRALRNMMQQMQDMQQQQQRQTQTAQNTVPPRNKPTPSKGGDYIDYEEVR